MATITDFDLWLDQADLDSEGPSAVYSLYRAVNDCGSMAQFECKKAATSEQWFVTCIGAEDTLRLASIQAKEFFLAKLTKQYSGDFGTIEGWYAFHQSMAKDD